MKYFYLTVITILLLGCENTPKGDDKEEKGTNKVSNEKIIEMAAHGKFPINDSTLNASSSAKENFYYFVNGEWMEETKIPEDKGSWGSFNELRENTDSVMLGILKESLSKEYTEGTEGQKVADMYECIMDMKARDKAGTEPIQPYLKRIDEIKTMKDLESYLSDMTKIGSNYLYGFGAGPNPNNSNQNILYLGSASLGMGRDYYQKKDEKSQEKLKMYEEFLADILEYSKVKEAKKVAADALAFEKEVADLLLTNVEIRDPQKRNNPTAIADLGKMVKNVDIATLLETYDVKVDTAMISELKYYENLDKLINEEKLPVIKNYLKASLVNEAAGLLDSKLEQMNFDFYSTKLNGVEKMRDRDKRALSTLNGILGEALGKLYVAQEFSEADKAKAKEMVNYIVKSFEQHIDNLTWMSAETKVKAKEKLGKFTVKIGYPDKWKDYSELTIKPLKDGGSYIGNLSAYSEWSLKDNLAKLNKPVDKNEWNMSPQTVNAYYHPLYNQIVFPAAILQPPFYDANANMAVNFGGIGAVIGHEITHGFDDKGAQFDGDGNLNNWWTTKDQDKFSKAGEALATQYAAYEPYPGENVNGYLTLGENIADLGGVNVSYDGLQMYMKDKGRIADEDGKTAEQMFFISWATVWRTKAREKTLKNVLRTDTHSPGYYRAFGPLVNIKSFQDAFGIKEGDGMYKNPEHHIVIW